jgi:hypothetical protein
MIGYFLFNCTVFPHNFHVFKKVIYIFLCPVIAWCLDVDAKDVAFPMLTDRYPLSSETDEVDI